MKYSLPFILSRPIKVVKPEIEVHTSEKIEDLCHQNEQADGDDTSTDSCSETFQEVRRDATVLS